MIWLNLMSIECIASCFVERNRPDTSITQLLMLKMFFPSSFVARRTSMKGTSLASEITVDDSLKSYTLCIVKLVLITEITAVRLS